VTVTDLDSRADSESGTAAASLLVGVHARRLRLQLADDSLRAACSRCDQSPCREERAVNATNLTGAELEGEHR
jgi:hypothetical protein